MPGIYVRKASWIDWTQKEENPTLIVPGSYWLCHKTKIYKFIFRYHRTSRNMKHFNFGRELMKIIRRIIKDQPPQNQQFGTNHLLVTFHHTSWTRQDKIFAMLKFKERPVVAFSHAFILTIKVVNSKQNSDNTISQDHSLIYRNENSNNTHKSENEIEQENEKCLLHSSKIDYSKTNKQCDNIQEQILKYESKSIQLNNKNMETNFEELSLSKESAKQPLNDHEAKFKFCKDTNMSFKVHMSPKHNKELNDKMEQSNVNCVQNQDIQLSDDRIDINNYNIEKDKNNSISNNSKMLNGSSINDDANTDSVNLPYQYLIEKEIENAKQNTLEEVNEKDTTNNTEITKIEDPPCSKKKKNTLEVPRSSDITDLVMEGLMFTIRQGQDAIAVIEQKTKLEVDEVLENSEKIETEEGEKCLRNSSLLGLENLVTMIKLPKRNEFKSEHQNVINQKFTLQNQSMSKSLFNNVKYPLRNNEIKEKNFTSGLKYSFNNSILASTSYTNNNSLSITNKRRYSDIHDKCGMHIKVVKNKYLKYEEEKKDDDDGDEEDEDEDIVPEALQNETLSSTLSVEFKDELKSMPNKDLLMDDIDNEDLIKFEIGKNEFKPNFDNSLHFKRYSRSSNHNSISTKFFIDEAQKLHKDTICESKFNDANKYKSNVPVIISNQIITLNEMPLPLQKILRNKLSTKHNPLNDKNKINKDNIEVCKTQACQNENNASNAQLGNQISDNILTSRDDKKILQDNRKTYNESTLNTEQKCSNMSSREVIKLTEEKLQKQDDCIDKPILSSTKIKNITQEFYKNFSYLKKENLTNQKYLRSRRKSLHYTNNGEMHIQMLKFFQDITRGAKVVVTRIKVNKCS